MSAMGTVGMGNKPVSDEHGNEIVGLTAKVAAAYLGANPVARDDIPAVIEIVHAALASLRGQAAPRPDAQIGAAPRKAAVPIKKSVTPDYLVCLEDGRKLKMLKRHLRTAYGLTPEEYRAKWGLPPDYPMVAPNYAQQRSAFAKKIGLGRIGRGTAH